MSALILAEPPVVMQQDQHVCWAAAFESWARAQGLPRETVSMDHIVALFSQIGSGTDPGHAQATDAMSRLLPEAIQLLAEFSWMQLRLVAPHRFTASFLCRQLQQSHVYLVFRRHHSSVSHAVVVYGLDDHERVLYMDPNVGLTSTPLHDLVHQTRLFGVGTALLSPIANPFR
jgi:hypothetical protein